MPAKLPPLYIIHGWAYSVAPWQRTLELLKKRGLEVKMLEVPGLTAPSSKVWTIADYVTWAKQELPEQAIALGHSNGGRILLNLCASQPQYLKHLILLDSAGVYEASRRRDLLRKLSKLLAPAKRLPLLRKLFHKLIGASDYARAPENMKQTLANMLDSDKQLDLTKVTTPVSILWGEQDTVTPPRQAIVLHTSLAHSTLRFFPTWTHAPYIADPESLAQAIYETMLQLTSKEAQ